MRRWLGRRSTLFIAVVLILVLSQFSFFAPVRDALRTAFGAPERFLHTAGTRFKNAFNVLFAVQDLAKENTALKAENISQEATIAKLSFALGENEQLKKDLKFKSERQDLQLTAANVVNYSPTNLYQSITINKGSDDGVRTGQAVVSSGYLIGKINNVSKSTSEIWLLSNRNLLTPVLLTDSQTVGLLKGSIRGLVVENIPLDTKGCKRHAGSNISP